MLNTVHRVGQLLDLFTVEQPEWRLTDLASELGISKSSTHSLVTTLVDIGLLSASSQRRYRLGWKLATLSERMRASLDVRQHALPAMQDLSAELRETVLLSILDRDHVVYLERVEGSHPTVRLAGVRVGARIPAHCTATGKVLLADRREAEVRALLPATLPRATVDTIATRDAFLEELARVRSRGMAIELGEAVSDVSCIAAPIHDRFGSVVAGMSVSVPGYRFAERREVIAERVVEAAQRVSDGLVAADRASAIAGTADPSTTPVALRP